jgi:hypothetical protein
MRRLALLASGVREIIGFNGAFVREFGRVYMDPPALSRALEWNNTLRDRCRHISGL